MTTLALDNIINISVQQSLPSLLPANANDTVIFTEEQASSPDDFFIVGSLSEVATLYGTTSTTYSMVASIFAQNLSIKTGNGNLVLIPLLPSATSATSGSFVSADITANLANFQAISDGEFALTIDGQSPEVELTNLDFTNVTSLAQVASIIDSKLIDADVSENAGVITIASNSYGASSTIALSAVSGGSGTDLTGSDYLDSANGTTPAGVDASGETLVEAMTRIDGDETSNVSYVNILTDLRMDDAAVLATAQVVQAMDRIFWYGIRSKTDISGIATSIQTGSNTKTAIVYDNVSLANLNTLVAGAVSISASVNFAGVNTANTLMHKIVNTAQPSTFNQALINELETAGVHYYISYGARNGIVLSEANSFPDVQRDTIALKFALQVNAFNTLATTNTKIPQTTQGMEVLTGNIKQGVLSQFVANGVIAPGAWNGDTFGNTISLRDNVANVGYYVYYLPITQQSQADREQRKAPPIQIAIKLAGAIHKADIIVIIEE